MARRCREHERSPHRERDASPGHRRSLRQVRHGDGRGRPAVRRRADAELAIAVAAPAAHRAIAEPRRCCTRRGRAASRPRVRRRPAAPAQGWLVLVPSRQRSPLVVPSRRSELRPQQRAVPSRSTAQVWYAPAPSPATPARPGTTAGALRLARVPSPSTPSTGDDTHHERRAAPDDGVHLRLAQRLPPAGLASGPPRWLGVHPAARPGVRCRRGLQRVRRPVTPFGSRAPIAVAWSHAARADH